MEATRVRNFFKRSSSDDKSVALGAFAYMPGGVFDIVLASVFINVLGLALPLTLLQVYDRIIPNDALQTLMLLVLGVGGALILDAILKLSRSYVSSWMAARFEHLAGCNAMERLLHAPIINYEDQGAGVHLERINALGTLKEFYAGQAVLAVCDLPFAVIYLGAIFYLADYLVFVPIVLIIAFIIMAAMVGQKLKKSLEGRMMADDRRYNFIIEVLGGIHSIKGLAMEEQMQRRYEKLQETCADSQRLVSLNSANAIGVGSLFSQLTMFAVVGFGASYVIDGLLTIGGLAACTMLSGRSMQPLQRAVGIWTRFQSVALARERLQKLFTMKQESEYGLPALEEIHGDIELQNITFNFGTDRDGVELPTILKNASMKVPAGSIVGVKGGNASGKTTLLNLINGLTHPLSGNVLIDGVNINNYDPVSVRTNMCYLPQEGVLFNGTLLENLTMFRDDLNDTATDMARLLGLDQVVAHMPMGYDTAVGDGAGETMPSGIVQRVAIARALVNKPRILLFDEANSSMDSEGDEMLKDLLIRLKGRVTMVLVTPRPSLLSLADIIYEIKDYDLVLLEDNFKNSGSKS
ncbi:MAG: ATP-binding cassette domain-containing protein [Rhodospirillales bacterium]|nr:ATP-binding cassette domain-containing protein [Rhodospirillales bacterium]